MLSQLRVLMAAGQRATRCRRRGHLWTEMAYPPACAQCGRTRAQVALEAEERPVAA